LNSAVRGLYHPLITSITLRCSCVAGAGTFSATFKLVYAPTGAPTGQISTRMRARQIPPIVLPCTRLASRFSLIARSPVSDTCGAPEGAAGSEAVPFQNHGGELMVPPTGGVPGLARTVSWSTWTPDFVTQKRPAGVAEHPARRTGGLLAMLQRGLARKDGPQSLRRASHRLSHKPGNGRDPVPDSCLRSECSKILQKVVRPLYDLVCLQNRRAAADLPLQHEPRWPTCVLVDCFIYSANDGGLLAPRLISTL
jgi:hypothetical protein